MRKPTAKKPTAKQRAKAVADRLDKVPPGWSAGDREFSKRVAFLAIERLERIEDALDALVELSAIGRKKRKPNAYSRFFAEGMKAGKTPKQIGEEWRAQKKDSAT
jgi:hypothetical protein